MTPEQLDRICDEIADQLDAQFVEIRADDAEHLLAHLDRQAEQISALEYNLEVTRQDLQETLEGA